jgi:hypothetical protein
MEPLSSIIGALLAVLTKFAVVIAPPSSLAESVEYRYHSRAA